MENVRLHINEPKLTEILRLISKAIQQPIRFYDTISNQWICSTQKNHAFCYTLERHPVANQYCFQCDRDTDCRCTESYQPFFYYCHAGLLEIVCPVWVDEVYAGYLTIGQYRTRKYPIDTQYLHKLAEICQTDYDSLLKKYKSHSVISSFTVEGLKLVSSLCGRYIIESDVFSKKNQPIMNTVEQYIQTHIDQPLTLNYIAQSVYMNPSYLSSFFKKNSGTSLSSYIQQQRISSACRLIRMSNHSFADIAVQTGFKDTNYFGKVFKKVKNMTPGEYRRKWKSGELIIDSDF